MDKFNILVFPCGSEIGLEIYRSLRYSSHINIFGGSSVDDHGRFVYENYIGNLPFVNDKAFVPQLKRVIEEFSIDAVYPAMDSVILIIKENEEILGCRVICSHQETAKVCLSKSTTYRKLMDVVNTPCQYNSIEEVKEFPVFIKPDIGYGSRGAKKVIDRKQAEAHLNEYPSCIILEYLPGNEYTIDCFTNFKRKLLFAGPRERKRIMNGISVNTSTLEKIDNRFFEMAELINEVIHFRGAWFFQVKQRQDGAMVLLEIASRLGGSSGVYRCKGINFALLSVFDAFDFDVDLVVNAFHIEMDRALDSRFLLNLNYDTVYLDFDDTLIIDGEINTLLIRFLYQCINEKKKIVLLTKHTRDIKKTLQEFRLGELFDDIIHLTRDDLKGNFITGNSAIFIDDSFSERRQIFERFGYPVFAPDAVESLIRN